METLRSKAEALLFSAGKPLSIDFIQKTLEVDKRELKKALTELHDDYSRMNGAVYLSNEDEFWKFAVKSAFTEIVSKVVSDVELSLQTLKSLAVIAYKNPVLQSDVIKVRGTNAYDHIHELEKLKFIRRDKEGNSYRVYLTEKFFEYFDIEGGGNIRELFHKVQQYKPKEKIVEPVVEDIPELPVTRSGKEILMDVDAKLAALGERLDDLEEEKHVSEMPPVQEDDDVHAERKTEE